MVEDIPGTIVYERASRKHPMERGAMVIERSARREERNTEPVTIIVRRRDRFWVYAVRTGVVTGCFLLFCTFVLAPLGGFLSDQWHYGDGRVARLEGRFGHHDAGSPTQILAFESQGYLDLIEFPGGDSTEQRTYRAGHVVQQRAGHVAITLQVKDVNGDGLLDLLITPEGSDAPFVLFNNGSAFQNTPPQA
jgi:hypothetical protein